MAEKAISTYTTKTTPVLTDRLIGSDSEDSNETANFSLAGIKEACLEAKAGVLAYLSSSTATTITTGDTYYPISGTFTNNPIENFAAGTTYTPSIKYTGEATRYFKIDWHASLKGNSDSITTSVGVKLNNVLVSSSVMGTLIKTTGEPQSLSGTCVLELDTNDEVQLVVTANDDGDVITFEYFTTTIKPFFER